MSATQTYPTRTAILIAGDCHAGAGALAGVLGQLGATPARTVAPLARFNAEILRLHGMDSRHFQALPPDWRAGAAARAWTDRLARLLHDDYGDVALIVVTDPCLTPLLPLYQAALERIGYAVCAILPIRAPGAAKAALLGQDGLTDAAAELLWIRQMIEAERATRGCPRVWIDFDTLMQHWLVIQQRVSLALGLVWPRGPAARAEAIDRLLDNDRRAAAPDAPVGVLAARLWQAAQPGLRDDDSIVLARFDAIRPIVDDLDRLTVMASPLVRGDVMQAPPHEQLKAAQEEAARASLVLAQMQASISWRVVQRLHRAITRFPFLARWLRRGLKLAFWTSRGELRQHLRAWRAERRPALIAVPPTAPGIIAATIHLPRAEAPDVSVIIPSYGHVDVTLRCLASIAAAPPQASIEVLVAEDCSDDPDVARLEDVDGLRLLRNPVNLGFLRNCNAAATQARGRWLLLLNNDTELQPGAIDALLNTLRERPDAGLVGAKLVYPDGRLQEAGGVVWNDASAWNWGHGGDPAASAYAYVREVDYCSGAAMLVPAALFADLGGFDESFAPAYYEDVDLAFRIRGRGLKVLYQPLAVVVHHEGVSHGTDTSQGVKAYQLVNQLHFLERWRDVLAREHFANATNLLRAAEHARGRPTCLVIDHYVPEPDRDAGSRVICHFLHTLREAGFVVKFWPDNGALNQAYATSLQQAGIDVVVGQSFAHWIATHGRELDHVLLSRPTVAPPYLVELARHAPQAALSFHGVDVHSARMRRQAALHGDAGLLVAAAQMEAVERQLWRGVDVTITLSDEESAEVLALEPDVNVHAVTPYRFADFPRRVAPPPGRRLLFVAGFAHPPNVDAAQFLVREILPLLRAVVADVELLLVGSNPTPQVTSLAEPGVAVTGWVSDAELARHYATARAAVVPLRFGAGVKGKVAEALREGVPLVTTPTGAQGLPGLAEIVTVSDRPEVIAEALATLLRDDTAWIAASHAQTAYAESRFGAIHMRDSLLAALQIAAEHRAARLAATDEEIIPA